MPPVTVSEQRLSTALQTGKFALHARAIGLARDAHIHFGPRLGGNHIGLGAASRHAHTHRQSPLQVGPSAHRFHARANSRIALAPFSKSTPACAATPLTSMRQLPVPLRAVL